MKKRKLLAPVCSLAAQERWNNSPSSTIFLLSAFELVSYDSHEGHPPFDSELGIENDGNMGWR